MVVDSRHEYCLTIALLVAVVNLALLPMCPPYDYFSLQSGNIPIFGDFSFAFGFHQNHVMNANFLSLELIVVCCCAIHLCGQAGVLAATPSDNW